MPIPRGLKKKIENALLAIERKKMLNNWYLTKAPNKLSNIPDKSLVVILTPYDEKVAETG